jgi:hypothetical protein
MAMRSLLLVIAFFMVPSVGGCTPDRTVACGQAYDHLIGLAKRRMQPKQQAKFVARCKSAWDDKRHACLLKAKTGEEAMRCRVEKVRPG